MTVRNQRYKWKELHNFKMIKFNIVSTFFFCLLLIASNAQEQPEQTVDTVEVITVIVSNAQEQPEQTADTVELITDIVSYGASGNFVKAVSYFIKEIVHLYYLINSPYR